MTNFLLNRYTSLHAHLLKRCKHTCCLTALPTERAVTHCSPAWTECLCPPKFTRWILMLSVMVLEGEVFGRWSDHKGRAISNGISALIQEAKKNSYPLWGKKIAISAEAGSHQMPDLPAPWTWTSLSPKLWEINIHCLKVTQSMVFCYSTANRLSQSDGWEKVADGCPTILSADGGLDGQLPAENTVQAHCADYPPCLKHPTKRPCVAFSGRKQHRRSYQNETQKRSMVIVPIPFPPSCWHLCKTT